MEKEALLRHLKTGLRWEDEFVLQYDREPVLELLRTLGEEKFLRVKALLEENIKETNLHYTMLRNLIDKVEKGEYGRSV